MSIITKPCPAAPLQLLAEGSHAVPVLDASGAIVRMITQVWITGECCEQWPLDAPRHLPREGVLECAPSHILPALALWVAGRHHPLPRSPPRRARGTGEPHGEGTVGFQVALQELLCLGSVQIGELSLVGDAAQHLVIARFSDRAFDVLQVRECTG